MREGRNPVVNVTPEEAANALKTMCDQTVIIGKALGEALKAINIFKGGTHETTNHS